MSAPGPGAPRPPPQQQQEEEGSPPAAHPEDLHELQRICEGILVSQQHGDALGSPSSFAGRLARHLRRLPPRYLADHLAAGRAEDVRLHWRILDDCYDPDKRPVFHARFVGRRSYPVDDDVGGSHDHQEELHRAPIFLHEIVFATIDKIKLLHRVTGFLDEVGLHIHEAHAYTTDDGFFLAVFLVDGWETEDAGDLMAKIKYELALLYARRGSDGQD